MIWNCGGSWWRLNETLMVARGWWSCYGGFMVECVIDVVPTWLMVAADERDEARVSMIVRGCEIDVANPDWSACGCKDHATWQHIKQFDL